MHKELVIAPIVNVGIDLTNSICKYTIKTKTHIDIQHIMLKFMTQ